MSIENNTMEQREYKTLSKFLDIEDAYMSSGDEAAMSKAVDAWVRKPFCKYVSRYVSRYSKMDIHECVPLT